METVRQKVRLWVGKSVARAARLGNGIAFEDSTFDGWSVGKVEHVLPEDGGMGQRSNSFVGCSNRAESPQVCRSIRDFGTIAMIGHA